MNSKPRKLLLSELNDAVLDWAVHMKVNASVFESPNGGFMILLTEGNKAVRIPWSETDDIDYLWGTLSEALEDIRPLGSQCLPVPFESLKGRYGENVSLSRTGPWSLQFDILDDEGDPVEEHDFEWDPRDGDFLEDLDDYVKSTLENLRKAALAVVDLSALDNENDKLGKLFRKAQGGDLPALFSMLGLVRSTLNVFQEKLQQVGRAVHDWAEHQEGIDDFQVSLDDAETMLITLQDEEGKSTELSWNVDDDFEHLLPQALEVTWRRHRGDTKGVS